MGAMIGSAPSGSRSLRDSPSLRAKSSSGSVRYAQFLGGSEIANVLLDLGHTLCIGAGLAQRLHFAVPDDDHRFDAQYGTYQRLHLAYASSALEEFEGVD